MTPAEASIMTDNVRCVVVYGRIKEILKDCLSLDEEEVGYDSSLQTDLGAESIDLLDITFRIEREFGIKISNEELFPADIFKDDPACIQAGKITPHGLLKLEAAAPHVSFRDRDGNLRFDGTVEGVTSAWTVKSLVVFVADKIKEQQ